MYYSHSVTVTDNGVNVRKRKGKHTQSHDYKSATKTVSFEVDSLDSVQTDFIKRFSISKGGPNQPGSQVLSHRRGRWASQNMEGKDPLKIIEETVFSEILCHTLTSVIFFQYPSLKKLHEVKAHTNEIDDLDINPVSNKVSLTVSGYDLMLMM